MATWYTIAVGITSEEEAHQSGQKGATRCVFQNPRTGSNQYYYAVYQQYAIGTNNDSIKSEYSTSGTSWGNSAQTIQSGTSGPVDGGYDLEIHDDGSQLVVFLTYIDSDNDIMYVRGIIGDSDNDITWGTPQAVVSNIQKTQSADNKKTK